MGEPMRNRAQLRDGLTDVRVLMSHLMETGLRKDSAGIGRCQGSCRVS